MHRAFVTSLKVYRRFFLDFRVWGQAHLPPGPKICVGNHISSHDPFWLTSVISEPLHFVIGAGYASRFNAFLLRRFEQIDALHQPSRIVVEQAAGFLRRGEPVAIAPEGDVQPPFQLGRFYPGAAQIYRACPAPLVPLALVAPRRNVREFPRRAAVIEGRTYRMVLVKRGTFCINIGEPWVPDCRGLSDAKADVTITRGLRERISRLIEEVRTAKYWLE